MPAYGNGRRVGERGQMRDTSARPDAREPVRETTPGLLWAYGGRSDGPTRRLAGEDLTTAMACCDWVWIHVDLIDQRVHDWITPLCGLPPVAVELMGGRDTGLVFEYEDGELHGFCPDFGTDTARTSSSVGRFAFSASERLLVTGRRRPLSSLYHLHGRMAHGAAYAAAFDVLGAIVAEFCRAAVGQLRAAEVELDSVEDRLLEAGTDEDRAGLKEVRRLALALHRPVAAMVAQLRHEVGDDDEAETLPGADAFAAMASRLEALDQMVVHTSDRAKLLHEEIAAQLAEDSNRSLRTLTVMTALLMPGTLVVGIFGMNTGGLPFNTGGWGTSGALLVAGIATGLFYRVLVRAGASLKF